MLIIFDLDGVLLSASWQKLFETYQAMITAEGKDYRDFFRNLEGFKKWWNPDWRVNYKKIGIFDEEKSNRIFYQVYNPHIYLFGWVDGVMRKLAENHLLAVFTNRHRSNAERYLSPIKNYLSAIIGSEDVKKLKPDPEGIKLILKKTGFSPRNALMIGDRPEDIQAGKAAGVKTGAVKWGLGDWNELLSSNPDYAFEKPIDLLWI